MEYVSKLLLLLVLTPTLCTAKTPNDPSKVVNGYYFSLGCVEPTDCNSYPEGDYQSCQGCQYYQTCVRDGAYKRKCPAKLVWDDNMKFCFMRSSTCIPAEMAVG